MPHTWPDMATPQRLKVKTAFSVLRRLIRDPMCYGGHLLNYNLLTLMLTSLAKFLKPRKKILSSYQRNKL